MITHDDLHKVAQIINVAADDVQPHATPVLRKLASELILLESRFQDKDYHFGEDDQGIVGGCKLLLYFTTLNQEIADQLKIKREDIIDGVEVPGKGRAMRYAIERTGAASAIKRQVTEDELYRLTLELAKTEQELNKGAT